MRKLTNDEFVKRVANINPNIKTLEQYKGSHIKIKCECNQCHYCWSSAPTNLLQGQGCPNCSKKVKPTQNEFIAKIKNINSNIKILGKYQNATTKVKCQCLIDGCIWEAQPTNLLQGRGCPECAKRNRLVKTRKSHKQFIEEIEAINADIEILDKYINNQTKIKCKCLIDGHCWEAIPANLLQGIGCPVCNSPKGEKRVKKFLIYNNIDYISQHKFNDCQHNKPLSFDFYLPDYNMCIEYDGKQHFEPVCFGGISYEQAKIKLKTQVQNDNIKTKYCQDNNIKLLRIPYWEFDNIENILKLKINNEKDETF